MTLAGYIEQAYIPAIAIGMFIGVITGICIHWMLTN